MYSLAESQKIFTDSLRKSTRKTTPYPHWLLGDVLDDAVLRGFEDLPDDPSEMDYTQGRRATNNDKRGYFDGERQRNFPSCAVLCDTLQSPEVVRAIEETCGVELAGTYLRVEYTQDRDGFWLEPHTDIGVKKFTMLIYLSRDEDAHGWGTDIYESPERHIGAAPYVCNHALIFIPADNTWHGFEKRPINGIRKSLIVNYVTNEWRARHELAFPEQPIGTRA
ncbi:2OG-Fe(II) oxygenase [Varunaivibrio sulfuroxidans]|uniref:2-oxoglutarate-Fe(II)-dependent oxygenase superfamily protein n=1 Tax=Varunaivibrio sulfuroxidans TaxID=1773489 RepID=A0A4V2UN69_9PROT|nr:2OG-Fe(II) oxygenase [Varunaivibrio sulfuroxidans]TCS60861.1 hypothetical protein EDD55_10921 [Varunaivibrio sulfuroxidans]WES31725.1 2OG-Fe(II) oxygenase [Varunaivibrio sulfuroxidans]